jgi:uncharacterized damage-inducible protein DinB
MNNLMFDQPYNKRRSDMKNSANMLRVFAALIIFWSFSFEAKSNNAGFLEDFNWQLDFIQKRVMDLEEAVPQKDFNWRPAEGVRSISEVYRHIALGNYLFLKFAGIDLPPGIEFDGDLKKWDATTTNKEIIKSDLEASFTALREAVAKISPDDLERKVNFFGNELTIRNFMITTLNHLHEHLGQSIAYARSNGIVPPWSQSSE